MSEADLPTEIQSCSEFNVSDWAGGGEVNTPTVETLPLIQDFQALARLPEITGILHVMQELQGHNLFLIDRVSQLEATLEACQVYLRSQLNEGELEEQTSDAMTLQSDSVQSHVARLMLELEQSHQTACRQQSLIETMSHQLQTHQERVAQLERECALAQQRYEEQTHDLMQCEQVCDELRSRLRWQERYAFQLKTALEKTLDRSQEVPPVLMDSSIPCPWEETSDVAEKHTLQVVSGIVVEPIPASETASPTDCMESQERGSSGADILFDTLEQSLLANPDDTLWEDLARLIDQAPDRVAQTIATEGTLESLTELVAQVNLSSPDESNQELQNSEEQPNPFTFQPFQTFADLSTKPYHNPPDSQKVMAVLEDAPLWPAPVVYPHRNQKRLKSLAAIDLPNFPRLSVPSR
ncbi:MAG: hypothetical protein SFW36_12955 [Leptolyngbyaceae cyanobacterium bins.59]|nr:hypothetical protein [Leptolyngbyaceae cyanobacterium bins.59]